jgi:hypothetical protein
LIEPLTDNVLGQWTSPSLEAAGPTVTFPIGMTPAALEQFKQLSGAGDLLFAFSYTFHNVRQQYAAAISTAAREVSQVLQQTVTSANLTPGAPIFQTQANAFRDQLATHLVTEISTSSATLVPLVQTQLADHYLTAQTISINDVQDKALLDAIYGYLKPLLHTAEDKRAQESSTTTTHEEGTTIQLGGNATLGSVGGKFDIDQSDKDTIVNKTGITLEYSQTDNAYEPQTIKVYKLSSITDQDTVEVVSQAFLSQGGDPGFQDDTPIRSDFTEARVGSFKSGETAQNFNAVLPGMSFCFFGRKFPRDTLSLIRTTNGRSPPGCRLRCEGSKCLTVKIFFWVSPEMIVRSVRHGCQVRLILDRSLSQQLA